MGIHTSPSNSPHDDGNTRSASNAPAYALAVAALAITGWVATENAKLPSTFDRQFQGGGALGVPAPNMSQGIGGVRNRVSGALKNPPQSAAAPSVVPENQSQDTDTTP